MTEKEWLNGNQLSIDIWNNKYRYKEETLEEWFDRVSSKDPVIKRLIKEKKFLFGGRTLSNINTDKKGSYSNCYSHGYIEDSLDDIMQAATNLANTYKVQGGQGLSLSKIRPKGAKIKDTFESDGIVPFMEIFNTVTSSISQGGSRKGALMISLDIWHPEAATFITIKSDLKKINKANLSLEIDDEFMQAVADGVTEVQREFKYEGNTYSYTVNPVKLFALLCENACKYAEPGVLFTDEFRNYNLMQYVPTYNIETCNPCSEQPLPKHGACNLSSINLSEYITDPFTSKARIAYDQLKEDIPYIVKAMDDVLEKNLDNHALKEQRDMAYNYRNIGIGIMGLADALVKLGITYGSEDACAVSNTLMKFIFRETLMSSVALATDRGSFPMYDPKVWDAEIIEEAFNEDEIKALKELNRLRNCSLLSIAPTGSIGTMLQVSTGCEPFFALSYKRKTESLNGKESYYDVDVEAVKQYKEVTGNTELPNCFVTAYDVNWKDRITMQAALQEYCDTAISSTVNLPKGTSIDDIKSLYMTAWVKGLKGVTVYVNGSRDPILSTTHTEIPNTKAPKRPKELPADFYVIKSRGKQFIVLVGLLEGRPYEVFAFEPNLKIKTTSHQGVITKKSKMHYAFTSEYLQIENLELVNEDIEEKATTLYTSMLLRHGIDIKYIIKTIKKVNDNITSFSSAICRVLSKYAPVNDTLVCPNCGGTVVKEGGCEHCTACEWSMCE